MKLLLCVWGVIICAYRKSRIRWVCRMWALCWALPCRSATACSTYSSPTPRYSLETRSSKSRLWVYIWYNLNALTSLNMTSLSMAKCFFIFKNMHSLYQNLNYKFIIVRIFTLALFGHPWVLRLAISIIVQCVLVHRHRNIGSQYVATCTRGFSTISTRVTFICCQISTYTHDPRFIFLGLWCTCSWWPG